MEKWIRLAQPVILDVSIFLIKNRPLAKPSYIMNYIRTFVYSRKVVENSLGKLKNFQNLHKI